jgi:ribonuclease HI
VELEALSIDFKPRTAIKSQALIDFMAEWRENQIPTPVDKPEHWIMYFDGSLKLDSGGAGVLFISPRGEQLKYVLQIIWKVTYNEAEYEALPHGLCLVISLGIKRLLVYGDSLLVVQQVNKEWDCNKETMDAYVQEVCKLENEFSGLEVHRVVREHNVGADMLSKLGSVAEPPELFRFKCASHRCSADTNSTHFKRNNPLVCRVSARYNHGSTGFKQVYLA